MIALGVILLILAVIFHVAIFWTLGVIAVVVGVVLFVLGSTGRAVGGRRHYW